MSKILYIDMDGTCFHFHRHETLDPLFQRGYFQNLEPFENVIEGLRMLKEEYPKLEMKIISCCLDGEYIKSDKLSSLKTHMGFIDEKDIIFIKYGEKKSKYIKPNSYLLDDYTPNLNDAKAKGLTGIKMINDINWNKQTWKGDSLNYNCPPWMIKEKLEEIMSLKEEEENELE